jgi:hypothetical protein
MRPVAVLFGELIPADAEHAAKSALCDCDQSLERAISSVRGRA